VVQKLTGFRHSGRRGAFRSWLSTIAYSRACDFWRARGRQVLASDDSGVAQALSQLEDPDSALNRRWDEEHDQYVLRCLLDVMALELEASTVQAFRRVALEGASSEQVARELGLSVGAVYIAKSRVLRWLRQHAKGLIDEFPRNA
jgi:RNA polymerase sigma-70 factor (ECF subfamily)